MYMDYSKELIIAKKAALKAGNLLRKNKNNLNKIVKIVHLEIRKKMNKFLKKYKNKKIVILDSILSGGTSDQYVVEEIIFCLKYFGINALIFPDIGVAGIHRHKDALEKIENNANIKLLIVVAGNEGALFSVISSQTKLPMIAVPTNIGYGYGGKGETALKSALQSCSPGVVAVNIDNGFGAAAFAKKLFSF